MNCIIVDDEPLARKEMKALLQEVSKIEILDDFANALKAAEFLKHNEIDLIFLDIEMPFINGLEFARQIPKRTMVIFTTAYPQYAYKSYEIDTIDYLLKPISESRLKKAIKKAKVHNQLFSKDNKKNTIKNRGKEYLFIRSDRKNHKIYFKDILFVEGMKDYSVIHTPSQKLITAMNLKTTHKKLISDIFIRVSKSYVVNTTHIDSFNNNYLYIDEFEIPIGEVYKNNFFNRYTSRNMSL